jgi:hypothetical protein
LKQPIVGLSNLAKSIEDKFGMKVEPIVPDGATAATATTDKDTGQFYKILGNGHHYYYGGV